MLVRKIILISLYLLLGIMPAMAMQFRGGETIKITAAEKINEDCYIAGEEVCLENEFTQDVFVGGKKINIKGEIRQDLNIIGYEVECHGSIADDLRVIANKVTLTGRLKNSALIIAKEVYIKSSANFDREVVILASDVVLEGRVRGPLNIRAGKILIKGTIEENIAIKSDKLVLASGARILKNLNYISENKAELESQVYIQGEIQWQAVTKKDKEKSWKAVWPVIAITGIIFYKIVSFIVLLVLGILLLLIFPKPTRHYVLTLHTKPLNSLGWGLLFAISIPIIGMLLFVTIVGIPFAIILGLSYFILMLLGGLGIGYLIGFMLFKPQAGNKKMNILSFAIGFCLLTILTYIPGIGKVLSLLAAVMGTGGIWLARNFTETNLPKVFLEHKGLTSEDKPLVSTAPKDLEDKDNFSKQKKPDTSLPILDDEPVDKSSLEPVEESVKAQSTGTTAKPTVKKTKKVLKKVGVKKSSKKVKKSTTKKVKKTKKS